MGKITEYLRLVVFIAALLAGLQVPGFVEQYHQSLQAHLKEAEHSLAEFQNDADKYFSGDMDQLVAHYRASADQVFNAGGESIDAIRQRHAQLQSALSRFTQHAYSPYYQTLIEPVPEIQKEVWEQFSHTVVLDQTAIAIGVICGVLLTLVISLSLGSLRLTGKVVGNVLIRPLLNRRRASTSHRVRREPTLRSSGTRSTSQKPSASRTSRNSAYDGRNPNGRY